MGKRCIHIGNEIHKELISQRRSVSWLSNQLGCNRTNIYNIFNRESINTDLLLQICTSLHRDFFALYSQQFNEDQQ